MKMQVPPPPNMSSLIPHATPDEQTGCFGLRDYSEMIIPVETRKAQQGEGGHILHDKRYTFESILKCNKLK